MMRLARVETEGAVRTAVVAEDERTVRLLPLGAPSPLEIAIGGAAAREAVAGLLPAATTTDVDAVRPLAPIDRFRRDLLCVGWNYWAHFDEGTGKREGQDPEGRPAHPTFFTKGPGAVIGPRDDIVCESALSASWDYEAELALVIGRGGRDIRDEDAHTHVAAYLIANDVTARNVQRQHGGQWFKGKSLDDTTPLGPWLTTADEVDPGALRIECELDGRVLQSAPTSDMVWPVAEVLAELSRGMRLEPGDVVLTGTPPGVGNAREPQVFLHPGSTLVTRISGLGELRNRIADRPGSEA